MGCFGSTEKNDNISTPNPLTVRKSVDDLDGHLVSDTVSVRVGQHPVRSQLLVFDTCALINSGIPILNKVILKYIICIPQFVVKELKGMGNEQDERGKSCRDILDWIATKNDSDGIRIQETNEINTDYEQTAHSNDDHILGFAVFLFSTYKEKLFFVTDDKILQIKARAELRLNNHVIDSDELKSSYI